MGATTESETEFPKGRLGDVARTRSDVVRLCLAGGLLVILEMTSSVNWDVRGRKLARASLSVLSWSVMVSHLFSISLSSTAMAAETTQSPTDSSELSVMQSIFANAWMNSAQDPCLNAWPGVTCDGGSPVQHVRDIDLNGTGGIVPADFFAKVGLLPHLETLSLASCGLTGNLSSISGTPSFLSSMRSLDLSLNSFTGEIPNELGDFSSLQRLSLAHNSLEGEVPEALCQATSLTFLMLEDNVLGGNIPDCLGNLSNLSVLNFSHNNLVGEIPEALGNLGSLTVLDLALNSLWGTFPGFLTGLSNLTKLHLSGNLLEGTIPDDFGGMTELRELHLDSNRFSGPIPISICSVTSLQKLRLFDNLLTGGIPDDIGNLTRLTHLFLHVNQLSGNLPLSLGNLKLLQELQIQGNRFNGTLPGRILAGFRSLISLYVHFNELEGPIPAELMFPPLLANISLGFNNFSGPLPSPKNTTNTSVYSHLASVNMLSMCNNSLTGGIPDAVSRLANLDFLDVSDNQLNGSIPTLLLTLINSNRVQSNLIFNDFDQSSWSTIPGGGACLQLNNASINRQCQATGFSKGLGINAGGPPFRSMLTGQDFAADESFSNLLGSFENSSDYQSSNGTRITPWVMSQQGVVQESAVSSIITSGAGPPPEALPFDWTLFQTARVGGDTLSYRIGAMQAGDYVVLLLFAELDTSVTRSGQRVFSIYIQGELRYAALDIFNMTGGTTRPKFLAFPLSLDLGVIDVTLKGRGSWPATQEQMQVYRGPILSALVIQSVEKKKNWVALAAAVGAGGFVAVALLLACVVYVVRRRRRKKGVVGVTWNNVGLLPFKYAELEAATRKFSDANLLGQGAFGKVFKGVLPDGATVAIKQLCFANPGSLECLQNELQVISTVRHRNLVSLIGCCLDLEFPLIVCEYMPNGNLHDALFNDKSPVFLSWSMRRKVAIDIARGLNYLHEDSVHKIVHRDVKPANILLDSKLNAHIADFGMARLLAEQEIEVITGIMGTRGYMAPEYALNGQLSDKVDVFSYGVVLLELVIGKRGMQNDLRTQEKIPLCHWAWEMFMAGELEGMVDKHLGKNYDLNEVMAMLKVAIWCTEFYQTFRPSMSQVLHMLTAQAVIPPLPQHRKGYGEALDFSRPFGSNSWEQHMTSYGDDEGPIPSVELSLIGSCDFGDPDLEFVEAR